MIGKQPQICRIDTLEANSAVRHLQTCLLLRLCRQDSASGDWSIVSLGIRMVLGKFLASVPLSLMD